MKRKVNLVGPNTLTISLPRKWARDYNIKKGDELEVVERSKELIINAGNQKVGKKTIDFSGLKNITSSLFFRRITGAYRMGYEEIEILYGQKIKNTSKKHFPEMWGREYLAISELLRLIDLIGVEIVEQGKNRFILKELGATKPIEFEIAFKRILDLLCSTAADTLENTKKQKEVLSNAALAEREINKFSHFCLRLLHKQPRYRNELQYSLILLIEDIGDKYWDMARTISEQKKKLNKETFKIWAETNQLFNELSRILLQKDFNSKNFQDIYMNIKYLIAKILGPARSKDPEIRLFLYGIASGMREIGQCKMELGI